MLQDIFEFIQIVDAREKILVKIFYFFLVGAEAKPSGVKSLIKNEIPNQTRKQIISFNRKAISSLRNFIGVC